MFLHEDIIRLLIRSPKVSYDSHPQECTFPLRTWDSFELNTMNSWFYVGFVEGKDQCKENEAQDNNFNANVKVDTGTRKHKIPPELMHSFKTMQAQIKQKHSAKQSPDNSTHTYTYIMLRLSVIVHFWAQEGSRETFIVPFHKYGPYSTLNITQC